MGQTFGKMDPNATNTVMNGQVVATGTPGGSVVADPNRGLSGSQLFARKAVKNALTGLGGAMQGQNNLYGNYKNPYSGY